MSSLQVINKEPLVEGRHLWGIQTQPCARGNRRWGLGVQKEDFNHLHIALTVALFIWERGWRGHPYDDDISKGYKILHKKDNQHIDKSNVVASRSSPDVTLAGSSDSEPWLASRSVVPPCITTGAWCWSIQRGEMSLPGSLPPRAEVFGLFHDRVDYFFVSVAEWVYRIFFPHIQTEFIRLYIFCRFGIGQLIIISSEVGTSDRIPIAIGLSYNYRNFGLTFLSYFNYRTCKIGLPIVRYLSGLLDKTWWMFTIFCVFFQKNFAVLKNFWWLFAEHMSCWHPYNAVGVPAHDITV